MIKDNIYLEYQKMLRRETINLNLYDNKEDSEAEEISFFLKELLTELTNIVADKKIEFSIFWIDSSDVNASVVKIKDTYCIGLFRGIITSLKDHIENYYVDNNKIKGNTLRLTKNLYLNAFDASNENAKLGNYIFTMAFFYIIMHEFGHILCGHADKTLDTIIEMNYEQNEKTTGNYNRQAKEYMADFYGIANSLNMILASFHSSMEELIDCIGIYSTAIQSVFWIFNFYSKDFHGQDWGKNTHPHPIVRMKYCLALVEEELKHSLNIFHSRKELDFSLNESNINRISDLAFALYLNLVSSSDVLLSWNTMASNECDNEIDKILSAVQGVKEYYRDSALIDYI